MYRGKLHARNLHNSVHKLRDHLLSRMIQVHPANKLHANYAYFPHYIMGTSEWIRIKILSVNVGETIKVNRSFISSRIHKH